MADTKKPNTERTLRQAGPTVKQADAEKAPVQRKDTDVPVFEPREIVHTPGS